MVLPCADWCTQPRHTQSLGRGRLCGLERVYAPLRCVGIADFETLRKRGRDVVSSSSGPNHTEARVCVCVRPSSSMPSPRRQAEGPCDATHSRVQCMAGLALDPAERVG